MLFRQMTDTKLAQNAYLIGCQKTGEALIIDPQRDIDRYISAAEAEGLRITAVAETHIHADFLSGAREFAARGGVTVHLSDEGPAEWKSEWARDDEVGAQFVHDGDRFSVGNIDFEVVHTPGHTPEHVSYILTDRGGGAREPMGIASGDFVFVGDLGRPDLLESAAGEKGAMKPAARQLYASVKRFVELPESLQVWPGHGAGSACGKALGAVPMSTVGYEKRHNASIAPMHQSEAAFVAAILEDQPEPPFYFARMKELNRSGPKVLGALPNPERVQASTVRSLLDQGAVFVDTRAERAEFMQAHLPGSLYAPPSSFSATVGSYLLPEEQIVLIAQEHEVEDLVLQLIRIGLDQVTAFLPPRELAGSGVALRCLPRKTFAELTSELSNLGAKSRVLDVRRSAEFDDGHIEGALNVAHTRLLPRLGEIPRDETLYVHCLSGARAAVAAAMLARVGRDVVYIDDKFDNARAFLGDAVIACEP